MKSRITIAGTHTPRIRYSVAFDKLCVIFPSEKLNIPVRSTCGVDDAAWNEAYEIGFLG